MVTSRDKMWWLEVQEELQGGGLAHGNHFSSPCPISGDLYQHCLGVGVLRTESPFPPSLPALRMVRSGAAWGREGRL